MQAILGKNELCKKLWRQMYSSFLVHNKIIEAARVYFKEIHVLLSVFTSPYSPRSVFPVRDAETLMHEGHKRDNWN